MLRLFLLDRMAPKRGAAVPLFQYDHGRRAWFVNLADYSTRAVAGAWLKQNGLSVRTYKECLRRGPFPGGVQRASIACTRGAHGLYMGRPLVCHGMPYTGRRGSCRGHLRHEGLVQKLSHV